MNLKIFPGSLKGTVKAVASQITDAQDAHLCRAFKGADADYL